MTSPHTPTPCPGGWTSEVLQEVEVPIRPRWDCEAAYATDFNAAAMICAGLPEGGSDSCQVC